jgi:2-amino-4-hydroxy-6-hydroxymethyldihydropteridine diphosphokinase
VRWSPAYVAVGSNLDDPRSRVGEAFERMSRVRDTRLVLRSPLYRTRPLGPQDQPDFVNAVAGLLTSLAARELLAELQGIEQTMGRKPPPVRWGPRVIDLDLLVHGSTTCSSPELSLPHPGIHERNFVLYPLAAIAPGLHIPGRGPVADLARNVGAAGLEQLSSGVS